ncbi:unnamed protein product, partial [Callosobruchus maculatus]
MMYSGKLASSKFWIGLGASPSMAISFDLRYCSTSNADLF